MLSFGAGGNLLLSHGTKIYNYRIEQEDIVGEINLSTAGTFSAVSGDILFSDGAKIYLYSSEKKVELRNGNYPTAIEDGKFFFVNREADGDYLYVSNGNVKHKLIKLNIFVKSKDITLVPAYTRTFLGPVKMQENHYIVHGHENSLYTVNTDEMTSSTIGYGDCIPFGSSSVDEVYCQSISDHRYFVLNIETGNTKPVSLKEHYNIVRYIKEIDSFVVTAVEGGFSGESYPAYLIDAKTGRKSKLLDNHRIDWAEYYN